MKKPRNPAASHRGKTKRATGESAMKSLHKGGAAKVLESMYPQDKGRGRRSGD